MNLNVHPPEAKATVAAEGAGVTAGGATDASGTGRRTLSPPTTITNSIGMKVVLIPAGEFPMGSEESRVEVLKAFGTSGPPPVRQGPEPEQPVHQVRITKPFYLGAYEVTVGQFRKFVEESGYKTDAKTEYTWHNPGWEQTDDHPVVHVTWNDAVAFCEWLSRKEGVTYRLPTEAEWEYACRAGTTTRFWSGDDPETLAEAGNVRDAAAKAEFPDFSCSIANSDGHVFTAPVGQFRANAFGLFDTHGNALEWCADWYGTDYYGKSPKEDAVGPDSGREHVLRGGSWFTFAHNVRSADRFWWTPAPRFFAVGFRVARNP